MDLYIHDIKIANGKFGDQVVLQLFCLREDGETVFVQVKNFQPFFYIGIDGDLTDGEIRSKYIDRFRDEKWMSGVKNMAIIRSKKLIGFTDDQEFPFIKMSFKNNANMHWAKKNIKDYSGVNIYEAQVDLILKFFHSTGVRPCSYFGMKKFNEVFDKNKMSHCRSEYIVDSSDVFPILDERIPPPMVLCAYDIETSGINPASEFIFQVSMCFSKLGEKLSDEEHAVDACKDGIVICVGETESIDGTPILCVENELELLEKFREYLVKKNVSVLIGYNNYTFDGQFLYKRAEKYCYNGFKKIGFLKNQDIELREKTLESSALGKNELKQIVIPGRVEFDLYMVLRKSSHKLNSYKLNAVCEHFFGGNKDDVTYADILEACTGKDPKKLGVIAKYCYQDSWLVLKLLDRLKEMYDCMAMAKLCIVPLTYILDRGQQIKCFSLILNKIYGTHICNYEKKEVDGGEAGYQGATVIEAKRGFYDEPIVTLDFASLYPSIIQWKNLGYNTFVNDDSYRGIEGVNYEDFELSEGVVKTFAHRPGNKSIISMIEEDLGKCRKQTKREMKGEKNPLKYSLLDSRQKAQKVSMNSLYGYLGTQNGSLPLKEVAAAVTCTGRSIIERSKEYAEKEFSANVVYGDTDSILLLLKDPVCNKGISKEARMEYLFKQGELISEKITALFGDPILLEFENIYWPYLLVSKKRYAGLSWETTQGPPSMTMKGLVTVRRDNAPFVGKTATKVIEMLMEHRRGEVKGYLENVLEDLDNGRMDLSDLTIRKGMTKWEYSNPVPHAVLAMKIVERAKGQKFFREYINPLVTKPGGFNDDDLRMVHGKLDRVRNIVSFKEKKQVDFKYIIDGLKNKTINDVPDNVIEECMDVLKDPDMGNLLALLKDGIVNSSILMKRYNEFAQYDCVDWEMPKLGDRIPFVITRGSGDLSSRAEDPSYVDKKNCKVDILYYVNQQIRKPLCDLLKWVMDNPDDIFRPYERKALNANMKRSPITNFFKPVKKPKL